MTTITRRGLMQTAAATAILAGVHAGAALAQEHGGELQVGLSYEIDTMNVYSTGYLGDAQATIVEGLLAPDENARYVPVLATEVPTLENGGIELVEDGSKMRITYKLRPDVLWHDGEPFTSEDVKFTWEAVKDPAFIAESKSGTEDIESIETPDDHTVVVNYNTVAPDFASTLFTFGIMPRHVLEGQDLNTSDYNELPIGTGPFMAKEFEPGQYVVAERNPNYWRTNEAGEKLPYLDRIIFKMLPDTNTTMTQLRSGELDLVVRAPYNQAQQIEAIDGMEVLTGPLLSWQHVDFNFRNPMLDDLAVRQAFAHAIDRSVIIRAQGGFPEPIKSIVVPIFDFYDDTVTEYEYDPAKAAALLDEAGYTMGPDGVREKDGEPMRFDFVTSAGRSDDENVQQIVMAQLKEIGVDLVPDNKAGVAYREARYNGDYDLIYGRWITSADPEYSDFYGTGGANNGQGYSNPALDEVMKTLENSLDPDVRKKAASQMQHIVADEIPSIPLTTNVALIAKTERLKNFVPNPTNMTNFVNTSDWYLED